MWSDQGKDKKVGQGVGSKLSSVEELECIHLLLVLHFTSVLQQRSNVQPRAAESAFRSCSFAVGLGGVGVLC